MNFTTRFLWQPLTNLILESPCALCQRSTPQEFCLDCKRQIQRCQLSPAAQASQEQPPVFAWGHYGGGLKRSIAAFKYSNQPQLARPLAEWLATAWIAAHPAATQYTIVPIPLHASKYQERGFNQADLLAQHFCSRTQMPLQRHGLERQRATEAQFTLSSRDRAQNLSEAFGLGTGFRKQRPSTRVLLLDDIYTTGATVRSAAQTLRRHGISVAGVVVLARAAMDPG